MKKAYSFKQSLGETFKLPNLGAFKIVVLD